MSEAPDPENMFTPLELGLVTCGEKPKIWLKQTRNLCCFII